MSKKQENSWIGFDLDRSLAYYRSNQFPEIGDPIPEVLNFLKKTLALGWEVRIVTARVDDIYLFSKDYVGEFTSREVDSEQREMISKWLLKHVGQDLKVTNRKDFGMDRLYDDRAVRLIPNQGFQKDFKDPYEYL